MYGYGNSMFLATHGILAKSNAGTPPVNSVSPVISGSTSVGSTLTSTNGTWTGTAPITYTYQWYRGASQIVGATNSTYVLVSADVSNSIKCRVTATNAFGSANSDSNSITATWESDAQAFITAASITNPTQQSAINQLVVDLKGYGVWTKMKALYPFVGGTATTHKFNLKNPLDTDAAFRLVFNGGWTHSSTGALPNGTNAYADTKLIPSSVLLQNNVHISYYSRTNISYTNALIGCSDASYTNGLYLIPNNAPNTEYTRINQSSTSSLTGHSQSIGLFLGSRILSTEAKSYRNGLVVNTINVNSSGLANTSIYLAAANFSPIQYTICQTAFASIGDGLTDTEAANFYTAVQAFQTTLGRQV